MPFAYFYFQLQFSLESKTMVGGWGKGSGQLAFVQQHGLFFFVISKTIFFGQSQYQGCITPLFFIFPHKLYFHERNRDTGKPNDSEPDGQKELTKADFLWLRHCSGDRGSGCWSTLSSASAQNSETYAHIHTCTQAHFQKDGFRMDTELIQAIYEQLGNFITHLYVL